MKISKLSLKRGESKIVDWFDCTARIINPKKGNARIDFLIPKYSYWWDQDSNNGVEVN